MATGVQYFLQVDGKTLCLLCTIKYKKDMFKKRNGTSAVSSGNSSAKRSRHHTRGKQTEADAGYVVMDMCLMGVGYVFEECHCGICILMVGVGYVCLAVS